MDTGTQGLYVWPTCKHIATSASTLSNNYCSRFTTCLDSAKTGLRLTKDAFKEDQKQYGGRRALCMVPADKPEYADSGYQNYSPERSRSLDTFILDNLVAAGEALRKKHLRAYDTLRERLDRRPDRDLMRPLEEAHKKAKEIEQRGFSEFVKELELIKAHVEKVRESHRTFWASPRKSKDSEKKRLPISLASLPKGRPRTLSFSLAQKLIQSKRRMPTAFLAALPTSPFQ
jgi:hypothetical protein